MTAQPKIFTAERKLRERTGASGKPSAFKAAEARASASTVPAAALAPAAVPIAGPSGAEFEGLMAEMRAMNEKLDRIIKPPVDPSVIDSIQTEIADISGRIKATKVEMAAIRHPLASEDKFKLASEELGEVVRATAEATEQIMATTESIEEVVMELQTAIGDGYQASRLADISTMIVGIYEACNFQDLCGQRVTKVVRALNFIEERIDAMIKNWREEEFRAMPLPPSITRKDESGLDLHGPRRSEEIAHPEVKQQDTGGGSAGPSMSQDDIDSLFD